MAEFIEEFPNAVLFFTAAITAKVWLLPVPWFYEGSSYLLRVPKGNYVEMNFTMSSYWLRPTPCIDDVYLEVRDGYNQSANLLGVFCGAYFAGIVRSSGQNMWLRKTDDFDYYQFRGSYTNKTANITGKYW